MKLRAKIMTRNNAPVALLCDNDSPINYWDEPGDCSIRLTTGERWNPSLPGIHGGQYEDITTREAVAAAVAQFETMVGQKLPRVICASMEGRVV